VNNRTVRYEVDGSVSLVEVDVGDPGPGEIQLTGGGCGICSWDVATARLGDRMVPMAPPGHEGVGYVAKVGSGVSGYAEGDRVAGGGFANVRNVPAGSSYRIPESDLPDECWIVEPVACAVTGIDHCRVRPGQRIAVIGCGFMGLMIIQGLLQHPLDQLVAIDVLQERLDLALSFGVAEVHDPSRADSGELADSLFERDLDVVVDTSGSQAGLDLATRVVRRGGTINLFGWIKGEASFDASVWHLKGLTVVNSAPGAKLRNTFPAAIRMLAKGYIDLRPLVTHQMLLDDYPAAMKQIVAGDPTYIKGVVKL